MMQIKEIHITTMQLGNFHTWDVTDATSTNRHDTNHLRPQVRDHQIRRYNKLASAQPAPSILRTLPIRLALIYIA